MKGKLLTSLNTLLTFYLFTGGFLLFLLKGNQGLQEQCNDIKKKTFNELLDSLLHPIEYFPLWSVL